MTEQELYIMQQQQQMEIMQQQRMQEDYARRVRENQQMQHMASMQQQGFPQGYNPNYMQGNQTQRKLTKKDIIDTICGALGTNNYVIAEEFETPRTRHICEGGKQIIILDKQTSPLNTGSSILNIEYIFCPHCKKLILNRNSLSTY